MRVYQRIGPNTGISLSLEELGFWGLCFLVGILPFIAMALLIVAAVWVLAMCLMVLLMINGIIYHKVTGRDARVPVPGSSGDSQIEYWMEAKGWIRTPQSTLTRSM